MKISKLSILFVVLSYFDLCFGSMSKSKNSNATGAGKHSNLDQTQGQALWAAGKFKGRVYKIYAYPKLNWLNALITCVQEGGMLADLRDSAEYVFIRKLTSVLPGASYAWVGVTNLIQAGKFEWLGNATINTISKDFFMPGQPSGGRNENCGMIKTDLAGLQYALYDQPCQMKLPFICVYL